VGVRRELLSILRCPACGGELRLEASEERGARVIRGQLDCDGCAQTYPIEADVPRLLVGAEAPQIRNAFSFQWGLRLSGAFSKAEAQYSHSPEALVRWHFETCFERPPSGSWVLDAGCGSGDKAAAAAAAYPDVNIVAADLSDSLPLSAARWPDLPNLHFIQADVNHLPVAPGAVDCAMSWGVLHHTADTRRALDSVARAVADDGRLAVWIYPHPDEHFFFKRYYWTRDYHFLGLGHRLPALLRLWLVRLYCFVGYPILGYHQRVIARRAFREQPYLHDDRPMGFVERYRILVFMFLDDVAPRWQHRHRQAEVIGWLREHGFADPETDGAGHFWGRRPPATE
jgi:uncharacterized protein YbaR (Trm112 family)/SAM-dependent methyltransferase